MIMAAGAGTRLDPLTQAIPKPMVPVANIPIIELILNHIRHYGITDVVANTHFLADPIHKAFGGKNSIGVNFNYVYETELSGTAGGVKKCEWFFDSDESFVVISGDALTDINLEKLINHHQKHNAIATMALREVPMQEITHYGVVVTDENSRVIAFQEKPSIEEAKSNLVNTGIYVFKTEIFKYIPPDTFYDFAKNVFPALMANNEILSAHTIDEYWSDIGTLNQYRLSSYDILSNKVNIKLDYPESELGWCSSNACISPKAELNGKFIIGDNTIINDGVKLDENSIIGKNCVIEEGVHIRNAIIWDNVIIEKGAKLDDCIVASNARISMESIIPSGSVVPDSCITIPQQKFISEKECENILISN